MRNALAIQAGLAAGTTTPDYHSRPDNKAMKASSDQSIKNNKRPIKGIILRLPTSVIIFLQHRL